MGRRPGRRPAADHHGLLKASHRELDDRTTEGNPHHPALLPPDAFHLPVGRPVTHKIYRDAAHPSRLVLPFTKRNG